MLCLSAPASAWGSSYSNISFTYFLHLQQKKPKCLVAAVPDGTKESNASCCAPFECYSYTESKIRYNRIVLLCFYCFNERSPPMLDKTIRWSISVLNLAVFVHHPPSLENPCHSSLQLNAFLNERVIFKSLKFRFESWHSRRSLARQPGSDSKQTCADKRGGPFCQKSCVPVLFEELQESRLSLSATFIIIII